MEQGAQNYAVNAVLLVAAGSYVEEGRSSNESFRVLRAFF